MQIEATERDKPKGKSVLLFSGGMDSFIMAHLLKPDVLLYVPHGQKYEEVERNAIYRLIRNNFIDKSNVVVASAGFESNILNLGRSERQDGIIPLRNLYLLALAAQYGETLYIGAMHGDRTIDKSQEFLDRMADMLNLLYQDQHWCEKRTFEVKAPYKLYTKTELVGEYLHQGGNQEALELSYSCYEGDTIPCWKCKSCVRKAVALINNGIRPLRFKFENVEWLQPNTEIYNKIVKGPAMSDGWRGREDIDFRYAMLRAGFRDQY